MPPVSSGDSSVRAPAVGDSLPFPASWYSPPPKPKLPLLLTWPYPCKPCFLLCPLCVCYLSITVLRVSYHCICVPQRRTGVRGRDMLCSNPSSMHGMQCAHGPLKVEGYKTTRYTSGAACTGGATGLAHASALGLGRGMPGHAGRQRQRQRVRVHLVLRRIAGHPAQAPVSCLSHAWRTKPCRVGCR